MSKCQLCDKETLIEQDLLCDSCWEVKHRLDLFLESEKARKHTQKMIDEYKKGE